mmetsp:Transcript_26165/g.44606  ORF Transcript_26165/g.44606 Transcript_26165/m.44606 type:complete len:232 (+) Transcript_26165:83-778(+)|eukprot:CAMPEP_0183724618 /NCGR_PEP_ID=MMETSP0737-20130205/18041_1 /TAXON_ID=385413 /ORGANISM="Thalassiosira miniscula, Strain CCMP1093" /LENGTH=231 /DNA_ID=CAMNT_0025955243 /DNA_START=41 /DNA_END=736 /DNA_ORIENTATION=-
MASAKRLLKERANVARNPIPYVTFQDDADDDSMTDASSDMNEWRFILTLDPAHDSLDEAAQIGKAADSPYCHPPPSSGKKNGGLLSGVTRAAKSSKKSSNDKAGGGPSSTTGGPVYFAFQLDFPPTYPFKPPTITVLSSSYHPNIKKDTGEICDNVLTGDGWGPTINIRKLCARLRKFLCDPDPQHPLEEYIAQLLMEKPGEYASAAFKHAAEFATRSKAVEAMAKGKQKK